MKLCGFTSLQIIEPTCVMPNGKFSELAAFAFDNTGWHHKRSLMRKVCA